MSKQQAFVPRKKPSQKEAAAARIHSIWRQLRSPFLLPESICNHHHHLQLASGGPSSGGESKWEIYDFQV